MATREALRAGRDIAIAREVVETRVRLLAQLGERYSEPHVLVAVRALERAAIKVGEVRERGRRATTKGRVTR
jgi:uncharacterized protein YaiI (UPF0178 family)